jgi:hypothetical protein
MEKSTVAALSDERLRARIETLWDECIEGWKVGLLCTFLVSAPSALLERRYGVAAVTQPYRRATTLASSRLLHGVKELSTLSHGEPRAQAVLAADIDAHSWIQLQQSAPNTRGKYRRCSTWRAIAGPVRPSCAMSFTPMLRGFCCVPSPVRPTLRRQSLWADNPVTWSAGS